MRIRRFVTLAVLGLALALAAGCGRNDNYSIANEVDEPAYREGKQLVKAGRSQEALAQFQKVIARRGDTAPESHLEAGLLYLEVIKDPLAAIYHFRKYLELQPNSRQAPLVRERIDVALREFAKTLPGRPLDSVRDRDDLMAQIAQLQRENADLKAELIVLRNGITPPVVRSRGPLDLEVNPGGAAASVGGGNGGPSAAIVPPTVQVTDASPVTRAPDAATAAPGGGLQIQLAPESPAGPQAAPATPALAATPGRVHTVAHGDTLYSLAQQYYGDRSRWRDIYEANKDQLPSPNALKIGMPLKIP